jgi:hypothetical protein
VDRHPIRFRPDRARWCGSARTPFVDRKAALARLLRGVKAGILLNEHVADDAPTVFAHACRLAPRASSPRGSIAPIKPVDARSGLRSATPPASQFGGSAAKGGTGEGSVAGPNAGLGIACVGANND